MRRPSWRPAAPLLAAMLGALVVACGGAAPARHHPPHRSRVVTVRGSLLQVAGGRLTLQDGAGPGTVQVTFAPMATPIYAVTTVTRGALEPGSCVTLRGERDATGRVTASVLLVATSVNDTCPAGIEPPPPQPADPRPSPSPPSASSSPVAGLVLLSGQVLSVGGDAVAVEGAQGDPLVVVMPSNVQVLFFQPSGPSALVIPSCVVVQGTRSRHVIAARKIVDWPRGAEC